MSIKKKIKNYINETEIPQASDVLPFEALSGTESKPKNKKMRWIISGSSILAACLAGVLCFNLFAGGKGKANKVGDVLLENSGGSTNKAPSLNNSKPEYEMDGSDIIKPGIDGPFEDVMIPDGGTIGELDTGAVPDEMPGEAPDSDDKYEEMPDSEDWYDENEILAGTLTGGEIRDLKNWDNWINVFDHKYMGKWNFMTDYKITAYIHSGDTPLNNVKVNLISSGGYELYSAVTDIYGYVHLYNLHPTNHINNVPSVIEIVKDDNTKESFPIKQYAAHNGDVDIDIALQNEAVKLDLMFMIDTTGSMGDELEYLKIELGDVIKRVAKETGVEINTSVNFYRDSEDEYVVRDFEFMGDVDKVTEILSEQHASGGGDEPEAVHKALQNAINEHQWNDDSTIKLMFLVLDAPPHDDQESVDLLYNAILNAAAKGIRVIPVAASGADEDTQMLLRTYAVLTGGTFIFLDDCSGIGGSHDVTIDDSEYDTEYLNAMLIRIIGEYCGVEIDAVEVEKPEIEETTADFQQ